MEEGDRNGGERVRKGQGVVRGEVRREVVCVCVCVCLCMRVRVYRHRDGGVNGMGKRQG